MYEIIIILFLLFFSIMCLLFIRGKVSERESACACVCACERQSERETACLDEKPCRNHVTCFKTTVDFLRKRYGLPPTGTDRGRERERDSETDG